METAAIFTLAARRGVQAGCALLVSNMLTGTPDYIDQAELHDAELTLGVLAVAALSAA
jgi:uridine phosphorylase